MYATFSALLLAGAVVLLLPPQAVGQVNSWQNPQSGDWEVATNWSLGILPAQDQTVAITNEGYKAVGIFPSTVANYPSSLTVSNLGISAPSNALSTLLLNYTGLDVPLRVLNDCTIGTNGSLVNFYGSLEVDGATGGQLEITGGTFVQEGGLTVATNVATLANGSMNVTNAELTLGWLGLGGSVDSGSLGYVNQSGGSVACLGVDVGNGTYNLLSGILYAIRGTFVQNINSYFQFGTNGIFNQTGGTNYGDLFTSGGGRYVLTDGMVQGDHVSLAEGGYFSQGGGLVSMSFVAVSAGDQADHPSVPSYALTNGMIRCVSLFVGGNGVFYQYGGQITATNQAPAGYGFSTGVVIAGGNEFYPRHGYYFMTGGNLESRSMIVEQQGTFTQFGGTNAVAGDLVITSSYILYGGQGTYILCDGRLSTTNTGVGTGASFTQTGGIHTVSYVLSVSGNYDLGGGSLIASGMWMHGQLSAYGTASLNCRGLLDFGGRLSLGVSAALGQLRLSTNSTITFTGTPAVLTFQDSSAVAWSNNSILSISNWNGSLSGGGQNQIFFGPNGLSGQQLKQIFFINPNGVPGSFPAKLLPSGELVPAQYLIPRRIGTDLVLQWYLGGILQTATNLTGPYADLKYATSPYTNRMSDPQRFFRLRQPPTITEEGPAF